MRLARRRAGFEYSTVQYTFRRFSNLYHRDLARQRFATRRPAVAVSRGGCADAASGRGLRGAGHGYGRGGIVVEFLVWGIWLPVWAEASFSFSFFLGAEQLRLLGAGREVRVRYQPCDV